MKTLIRIILSLLLCWGVYTETGIWTTLAILLSFLGSEITAILIKKINKELRND